MQLELVHPFVEASEDVIRNWWPDGPLGSDIGLLDAGQKLGGFNVKIRFTGKAGSAVLVHIESKDMLAVAARMIGEPVTQLDDLARSALGELGNVLCGLAVTKLNHVNIDLGIEPPEYIEEAAGQSFLLEKEAMAISLDTADGRIQVVVYTDEVGP